MVWQNSTSENGGQVCPREKGGMSVPRAFTCRTRWETPSSVILCSWCRGNPHHGCDICTLHFTLGPGKPFPDGGGKFIFSD